MAKYNGHESKTAWNVNLWISNDEGLYNLARSFKRRYRSAKKAAPELLNELNEMGITETPDGFKYSKHNLELALGDI